MAGFADVSGTEIIVFLSQRRCQQGPLLQMTTQTGATSRMWWAIDQQLD